MVVVLLEQFKLTQTIPLVVIISLGDDWAVLKEKKKGGGYTLIEKMSD